MSKRSSYEIKKRILQSVKEKASTYAALERKVNTGYRTIKANCEELAGFGQVKIEKFTHPANGKDAFSVSITKDGLRFLQGSRKSSRS